MASFPLSKFIFVMKWHKHEVPEILPVTYSSPPTGIALHKFFVQKAGE